MKESIPIFLGVVIWVLLFFAVYFIGSKIIESQRRSAKKKWGIEERDYKHEKWTFRFYVIAFFAGVPLLLAIALWQELSDKF